MQPSTTPILAVGRGDSIQFVRYAPELAARGARVVVLTDRGLVPLFQTVPGVAAAVAHGDQVPAYDFQLFQFKLPIVCGTTEATIPAPGGYLQADANRAERWRGLLPKGRKRVGLVWAGSPANPSDDFRSVPFEFLKPILQVPNVDLISLQCGPRADDVRELSGVFDAAPLLTDYVETAAAISNLDLVITVDTSVAHLAGALWAPVWVMLRHTPDVRWGLYGQTCPWYSSARLFRQPRPNDWGSVVGQVVEALGGLNAVSGAA